MEGMSLLQQCSELLCAGCHLVIPSGSFILECIGTLGLTRCVAFLHKSGLLAPLRRPVTQPPGFLVAKVANAIIRTETHFVVAL
jgi:hypothetical protein